MKKLFIASLFLLPVVAFAAFNARQVADSPVNGYVLQTNGSINEWVATSSLGLGGSSGTVSSVAATVPTGLTVSGSPITTSGTLAIGLDTGYVIPTTASTTEWASAYASTTILTNPYIRGLVSGVSPISYNNGTGAFSLGTVDISTNTNLAVSSPITLTGDTVGFDFSTANTWTGGNTFTNATSTNLTATTRAYLQGALYDSAVSTGSVGNVLLSTGTSTRWTATSSLGITGTSQWTTTGSDIYYSTGKVGVGTSIPKSPFHVVNGSIGATFTPVTDETIVLQRNSTTADNAVLTLVAGSVGETIIRLTNAGDTEAGKIGYNNSTDAMYWFTNGVEKMRLLTSGNLGIGETVPGSKLSVSGNATIGASYDTTAAPTNGLIVEGNVGIASTTPSTKLDVAGDFLIGVTPSPAFYVRTDVGDGDNRVGINTRAPSYALTTVVDANTDGILVRRNSTSADAEARVGFRISNSDGVPFAYIAGIRRNTPVAGDSDLAFVVQGGGTLTEGMRLNTYGQLGVGTSTQTTNFQVTATSTNATTTATIGKPWQTKGSCLELFDSAGSPVYAYVKAGETTFTLSTTSCK